MQVETESDGASLGMLAESFADECVNDSTMISESTSLSLDLGLFTGVGLSYSKCTATQFAGPDTFFVLDAKQGERWNINVAPQDPNLDVAIIVLGDGCSITGCSAVRDRCGAGFDEDFAVIAEADTQYTISIESLVASVSGRVTLSLDKSVCGNGIVEQGESCDGEADCDSQCRREVRSGVVAEQEPNDIFTGVDLVGLPGEGGQVTITGSVGGPCDEDHYAFIVPDGASASVAMYSAGGGPCPDSTPPIDLPLVDFLAAGGPRVLGKGKAGGPSGGCPAFDNTGTDPDFEFARNLPASEYHLLINAFETAEPIPYEIVFDVQPTTPP